MLTENQKKMNLLLESISDKLDIPPSKYQLAVDRYTAVGNWLDDDNSPLKLFSPRIYPQGSFRLGTVVRPWKDGKEAEYDIDLVCYLDREKKSISPRVLKTLVGDRLKDNKTYLSMLDEEGRRCWTLEYAEADDIAFHMDVLPAIPEDEEIISILESYGDDAAQYAEKSIGITHTEDKKSYEWKSSNPEGYALWFDECCRISPDFNSFQKTAKARIFNENRTVYASVDQVPDQLVRTPLQRAIQILKRHRDVYFAGRTNESHRPISMIITTLAASFYEGEADVLSALNKIVAKIAIHAELVKNLFFKVAEASRGNRRVIYRDPDGTWQIKNPVNPDENFADRWNDKKDGSARATSFFQWVEAVSEHFSERRFNETNSNDKISNMLLHGIVPAISAPTILKSEPKSTTPEPIYNPPKPWKPAQ